MIVVFDTSTPHLAIGLATDEGELLHEFHATASPDERGIHDARLALETSKLLADAGAAANDIRRIGLVIGPGSFTGLRIGLSFAKGLAFAGDAAIVPLTTHEVMREEFGEGDYDIVVPGYREDILYVASSSAPNDIRIISPEELRTATRRTIVAHEALQQSQVLGSFTVSYVSPSLATMAALAAKREHAIEGSALDALEPLYLTEFNVGQRS